MYLEKKRRIENSIADLFDGENAEQKQQRWTLLNNFFGNWLQ